MLVNLNQDIVEEFIGYCKREATRCSEYEDVEKYVKVVDELTKPKQVEVQVPKVTRDGTDFLKKILNQKEDYVLKFHYPPSKMIRYNITSVKDGVFYGVRSKKLKLRLHEISRLKGILESDIKLESLEDWEELAAQFDVTPGAIQTYAYNIEIGTFNRYLPKKVSGQRTLDVLSNTCTKQIPGK